MASDDHRELAENLRRRITTAESAIDADLRRAAVARAAGGPALPPPYEALVHQIGEAASRVTDAQVAAVRTATGSDKAAFEVVMAAAVGAGVMRWDKAMEALDAAS